MYYIKHNNWGKFSNNVNTITFLISVYIKIRCCQNSGKDNNISFFE